MKSIMLALSLTACGAIDAADGSKPGSPSDCCWLIGESGIRECLLRFVEEPGDCVFTRCFPDQSKLIAVCELNDAGVAAWPEAGQ